MSECQSPTWETAQANNVSIPPFNALCQGIAQVPISFSSAEAKTSCGQADLTKVLVCYSALGSICVNCSGMGGHTSQFPQVWAEPLADNPVPAREDVEAINILGNRALVCNAGLVLETPCKPGPIVDTTVLHVEHRIHVKLTPACAMLLEEWTRRLTKLSLDDSCST